ncbi:MAG: hypothetical protein GY757_47110 [bacterium]|nr:hypothetical protein [bacterium]
MISEAVNELKRGLPAVVDKFDGSEFQLPVKTTFLGHRELTLEKIEADLTAAVDSDLKSCLAPILLAAEVVEASQKDKQDYFITDRKVQDIVFNGSKWKAGWVLVLGGKDQHELVEELKQKNFMVFTDQPGIEDTTYVGSRNTSPVYFLQLMVRYGLVWGQIKGGDDHQMGHFLETDMPGFIIIRESLPPLKYLITLGLLKMGAPAVVPTDYPFPYGSRVVADTDSDRIAHGINFPNLRQKYSQGELIELPEYCNIAYVNEKFEPEATLGGSPIDFICLRPAPPKQYAKFSIKGNPSRNIGILIDVYEEDFTVDLSQIIESAAIKAINFMKGVRATKPPKKFSIEIARTLASFDINTIGESIIKGLRLQYPMLKEFSVTLIFDETILKEEITKVEEYKKERKQLINSMNEDSSDEFIACTECRPFSLVHTCILTPGKLPMCASRTYFTSKAKALFGSNRIPHKRQDDKELPLRYPFKKGRVINRKRGEYQGCNDVYNKLTGGQLNRVFLHSLRQYPPTSCGCFQTLAFWIESVEGIGIMLRDSPAITPDGRSWEMLANYAGGKQSDGIFGVSINYIRSKYFLTGDGGIAQVVWVDSELKKRIADCFEEGQRVATEKNVKTSDDLKNFLKLN